MRFLYLYLFFENIQFAFYGSMSHILSSFQLLSTFNLTHICPPMYFMMFETDRFQVPLEIVWTATVSWHADDTTCRIMVFFRSISYTFFPIDGLFQVKLYFLALFLVSYRWSFSDQFLILLALFFSLLKMVFYRSVSHLV